VLSANLAFYRDFDVSRHETEGRAVYDLGNGQWNIPKLRELLETVLPALGEWKTLKCSTISPDLVNAR